MYKIICCLTLFFFSLINPTEGKVILITGASGDIGFAVAQHLVKGNNIIICHYAKNKEALEKLKKDYPEKIFILAADFNQPESIQSFWEAVLKCNSQIDIIINSAGIEKEDVSLEQIQMTLNVNYLSPRLLCDVMIDHFKKNRKPGIIINIGSRAAYRGLPKGYLHIC